MSRTEQTLAALLERHGQTFASELGIHVERGTPSPLFRLLVASILLSANIDHRLGMRAARAMSRAGYRTAQRMADASDRERWQVLADARYLRKTRTAAMLGDAATHAVQRWDGDLRGLRRETDGDVDCARELLCEFKGLGPVGADIFLREVQVAWPELHPFADERANAAARRLALPHTAHGLARHADDPQAFARLTAALVRCDLDDDAKEILAAAKG